MNPDKLGEKERCASTSNRNFEGRQGAGGRTHLCSPVMAAAAAVTGQLTDVRGIELSHIPAACPKVVEALSGGTSGLIPDALPAGAWRGRARAFRAAERAKLGRGRVGRAGRPRDGRLLGRLGDAGVRQPQGRDGAARHPERRHRHDHPKGVPQDNQEDGARLRRLRRAALPQPGDTREAHPGHPSPRLPPNLPGTFPQVDVAREGTADGVAQENVDFVLNRPEYRQREGRDGVGTKILVAGDNFGCGSSREHAPWSISGMGIRCIISSSFADIFHSNCMKNGMVPVTLPRAQALLELHHHSPVATARHRHTSSSLPRTSSDARRARRNCRHRPPQVLELLADAEALKEVEVDLEAQEVIRECGTRYSFDIDPFRKNCLLNGLDDIGLTMQKMGSIRTFETQRSELYPWLDGATTRVPRLFPVRNEELCRSSSLASAAPLPGATRRPRAPTTPPPTTTTIHTHTSRTPPARPRARSRTCRRRRRATPSRRRHRSSGAQR